jgi:hypothetical protein
MKRRKSHREKHHKYPLYRWSQAFRTIDGKYTRIWIYPYVENNQTKYQYSYHPKGYSDDAKQSFHVELKPKVLFRDKGDETHFNAINETKNHKDHLSVAVKKDHPKDFEIRHIGHTTEYEGLQAELTKNRFNGVDSTLVKIKTKGVIKGNPLYIKHHFLHRKKSTKKSKKPRI